VNLFRFALKAEGRGLQGAAAGAAHSPSRRQEAEVLAIGIRRPLSCMSILIWRFFNRVATRNFKCQLSGVDPGYNAIQSILLPSGGAVAGTAEGSRQRAPNERRCA
jgi:hypothetical protein